MSVKNVKAFFEKVEKDKTLQEKLKELDKKAKKALDSAIDELIEIAGLEGFNFTPQDLVEARNEKPGTSGQLEPWVRANCEQFTGAGCMPGMGLYVSVPVPQPDSPQEPGCVSTYMLDCVGHIFR